MQQNRPYRYQRYGDRHPNTSQRKINSDSNNNNDPLKNLPIYSHLPEIINTIKKNIVTIIRSDTGSGKTIGVANELAREKNIYGNIFCSVPTIAATISAHKYQSQLCYHKYNHVGFACEGNIQYNYKTKIVYCTTGHLLNKMVRTVSKILGPTRIRYNPWFCSELILDEFHIRTKESDICLCLWLFAHRAWQSNPLLPKPPKLVIMSATLDDNISQFFSNNKPVVLSYAVQTYAVTTVYDDMSDKFYMDSDARYIRAAILAKEYHEKNHDGVYLIFVPGKQEIDIVVGELNKLIGASAEIFYAHGELSSEELLKIHDPAPPLKKKIIVATNIAECSLTIENVSLVIDTLTHREANCGLDESLRLDVHWISKSSSKQRCGRTGRTCEGIYVPMMSEQMYSNLPETITPELERISFAYDILRLMKSSLDPKVILAPVISERQIDIHINLLKKLGFIRDLDNSIKLPDKQIQSIPSIPTITDMGDFCSEFPLGIRKSAMLYHLRDLDNPDVFLHLAVICTLNCYGSGIFYWPKRNLGEDSMSYSMRCDDAIQFFEEKFAGYSDVDTIFNIWIKICSEINPFYITDLRIFCRDNQLNFRRFKEIVSLLKQCVHISNRQHIALNASLPSNMSYIDTEELGRTFYYLLGLTHLDYVTTIKPSNRGGVIAMCGGLDHSINNRSINKMNIGNNYQQIYYSLIRTQRTTKKGVMLGISNPSMTCSSQDKVMRMISVMHAVPSLETDDENFSIFSSDIESGSEIENLSQSIDLDQNNFLSIIEAVGRESLLNSSIDDSSELEIQSEDRNEIS